LKWQNDKDYRDKVINSPTEGKGVANYMQKLYKYKSTSEVRARISATLKAKWNDPQFRERMMSSTFNRTDEWRK